VIFAAYYMLPMVQKVLFNGLREPANRSIPDLNAREITVLMPLVVLILWIGVYPRPFLDRMEPSVNRLVQYLESASGPVAALPPSDAAATAVAAAVSSSAPSPR
jgi:NADH-quinone oxidoreductase subunit M